MYLVKYNKKFSKLIDNNITLEVQPAYCLFYNKTLVAYGISHILPLLKGCSSDMLESLPNGRYEVVCSLCDRV